MRGNGFNNMKMMMNTVQRFNQFRQQFSQTGQNPEQMVQELLKSGQMSQEQFSQFKEMANSILGTKY